MIEALLDGWSRSLGDRLPLRREVAGQFLSVDLEPSACWAGKEGLVVAKRRGDRGHLAALLVHPEHRGRGHGRRLLEHAVGELAAAGAREVVLGADYLHLLPGVPEPGPVEFFRSCGFDFEGRLEQDLCGDLGTWSPPPALPAVAPAGSWDEPISFLAREFPGRWHWEAEEARRRGGSPAYYLLLRVAGESAGFARIQHHLAGAPAPGLLAPGAHWTPAEPPFGGLGPIGVGAAWRGRGLGLGLLQGSLAYLKGLGVRQMGIDWTTLAAFYGRAGFVPCRAYRRGRRRLQTGDSVS